MRVLLAALFLLAFAGSAVADSVVEDVPQAGTKVVGGGPRLDGGVEAP